MTDAAALFKEAEVQAERSVALARLVVLAVLALTFFGMAYGFAPSDRGGVHHPDAIGGALVMYLALAALSFVAARAKWFRPWFAWLFVTIDAVFLAVTEYFGFAILNLPGAYAAALPVIWLAPLLLAFAALRYDPLLPPYVAVLILVAMLAVGGLRPSIPPEPASLAFAHDILPNIMRAALFLFAGAVLGLSAFRARRLLERAIAETARRANLTRFLPPEIADVLSEASADRLRTGARQNVAVLFADIRGFTARAETMDPAALGRFVGDYRRLVSEAARRHGGVIDKFIGDAAMILFGVPAPRPDDAARALACGQDIIRAVEGWNATRLAAGQDRVAVGVGVHVGEVFCGAVGDDARLEFTVLGDAVNTAARLEKETKEIGRPLLVSGDVLRAAEGSVSRDGFEPVHERALRGRSSALALFAWRPQVAEP